MLGRHLLGNGAPAKPGDSWTFTTSDVFAVPVTGTYEVTLVGGGGRGGAGGKTYSLVTSAPTDWSGDYVLVGVSGSTAYVLDASGSYTGTSLGSTSAAKTLSAAGITLSGNTLSGVSDDYVYSIEKSGSYYAVKMKDSSNYLRYKANGLTTLSSLTYTSQQWTLSLSSTGAVLMKNRAGSSYYLGFNASAKLFRCYTSTSSYKLYLFKAD